MSKARKIGLKATFTPNKKADMRHRKKVYLRGIEKAYRSQYEIPQEKEDKELRRLKENGNKADFV